MLFSFDFTYKSGIWLFFCEGKLRLTIPGEWRKRGEKEGEKEARFP